MKYVKAYLAIFLFNVIVASVLYIGFPTYLYYLLAEDGVIENLSAAFFLLSFFLAVASLIKREGHKKILIPISALGLIGFLDELSFGERVFGFSALRLGGVKIDQAHDVLNLLSKALEGFIDSYGAYIFYVLVGVCVILSIMLFRYRSKLLNEVSGMIWKPHYILLLFFFMLGFLALLIDLKESATKPLFVLEETLEMNAAMALCFTCLSLAKSRAVVLVTLLVLVFVTGILTLTASPRIHTLYYHSGVGHQKRGQYDQAIADYSKAIEARPNDAVFYYNRGGSYQSKGEYDLAISDFTKVIELEPDNAEAYYNRGGTYYLKGQKEKARRDMEKARALGRQIRPGFPGALDEAPVKGQYDQAIADYSKAIEARPNDAVLYYNRGIAYQRKGQYDSAISDFTKTIEMDRGHAGAYNNRGVAYRRKGEYDRSISDLTRAIEMRPGFGEAYNNRGVSYYLKGRHDKARSDVEKAMALGCQVHPGFLKALDEASVKGK